MAESYAKSQDPAIYYDESLYPRPASESDMESEQSTVDSNEDHTSVNMETDSGIKDRTIMDEFTCIICTQALIDPMTLNCGHSFCQLCLAAMWAAKQRGNPLHLQCPVCRQPWKTLPAVNIQLRNITEHSYPSIVESRRAAMTKADLALISQFSATKYSEYQATIGQQNLAPEVRRMISILLVFFGICIIFMVIVFCLLLWVWAGAGGEFMRKPVGKWSNEDVIEWVGGLGEWTQHNYSDIFRKEKITGPRLLLLNEKALETIGVHSEYRRQTILQAIQELKVQEYSTPRNFQEFKAAHRKQTLLVTVLYKTWPRLTFLYTYFFCYYEIFLPVLQFHFPLTEDGGEPDEQEIRTDEAKTENDAEASSEKPEPSLRQLFAFTLEVLLIPHVLVAGFAWSWFDLHFWICLAVIIHCCWATVQEGRATVGTLSRGNIRVKIPDLCRIAVNKTFQYFFQFAFFFIIATVIWHITPHFVCDILFYLILWHTFYMHIALQTILKFFPIQRPLRAGVQIRLN